MYDVLMCEEAIQDNSLGLCCYENVIMFGVPL